MTDQRQIKGAVRRAVGAVLFNASNFPEKAQAHLLGQNMGPLNEKITDAVLAALEAAHAPTDICGEPHPITGARCSRPAGRRHGHVCDLPPTPAGDERDRTDPRQRAEYLAASRAAAALANPLASCQDVGTGFRLSEVPESSAPARITIEHENGNTVTGTPEEVLNHGHLKPGWRYRGSEPQAEPSDAQVAHMRQALNAADIDYSAREQRADAGGGEMEPGDWFTFLARAALRAAEEGGR